MDQGIVDDTYKQENHDMPNTITALRELSGDPLPQSETADIKNDSGKFTFKLQEIRGDLFSCSNSTSLAHCVSVDLKMDKGIAVSFKSKFGGLDELEEQKKTNWRCCNIEKRREVCILSRHKAVLLAKTNIQ